jgi:hypothetical protein
MIDLRTDARNGERLRSIFVTRIEHAHLREAIFGRGERAPRRGPAAHHLGARVVDST